MQPLARLAPLAAFAVLVCAARADADVIDDHPLACDLRAAFSKGVSSCTADECLLDLNAVTCTGRGMATTCRAGRHTAHGRSAHRLAQHLREIVGTAAATVTLANIACLSHSNPGQAEFHGRCYVERTAGDKALHADLDALRTDDGDPLVETCKLGQFCWTGALHVACKRDTCAFSCPPGSAGKDFLDACHLAAPVTQTNAALAADLRRRTGRDAATLSCSSSGGAIDGGLTSLVQCDVR